MSSNYKKNRFKNNITISYFILLLDKTSNFTEYIYCHSLWHILMGITLSIIKIILLR